jgi:ABC-type transporter MlaC component
MANKLSTTTQRAVDNVLFDLVTSQRAFSSNYGEAIPSLRRSLIQQVTITTAAGLVLGGLLGTIVGLRRR